MSTHLLAIWYFFSAQKPTIKNSKVPPSQHTKHTKTAVKWTDTATTDEEALLVTRVWQKWRISAPQTNLWLIKVWFSASTFVVKIALSPSPKPLIFYINTDGFFGFDVFSLGRINK
jgi:hypothetical protein